MPRSISNLIIELGLKILTICNYLFSEYHGMFERSHAMVSTLFLFLEFQRKLKNNQFGLDQNQYLLGINFLVTFRFVRQEIRVYNIYSHERLSSFVNFRKNTIKIKEDFSAFFKFVYFKEVVLVKK